MMNFFVSESVAERYAKHRPYFHPLVAEKIKAHLQLRRPTGPALDVGCGAGQSTVALKEIAELVIGADVSAEMLRVAKRRSGIFFIQVAAEKLAIESNSCDLVTTSLAYHWFDQEQFLAEVRRILKNRAWLIIYNHGFTGQMQEEPGFEQWTLKVYERRYPSPPRNSVPMAEEFAQRNGFHFSHQEEYQNEVELTMEELAAYLLTQSNVIAATEQGNEKVKDVYDWLIMQIRPFFKSETARFLFGGYIWYLQRSLDIH